MDAGSTWMGKLQLYTFSLVKLLTLFSTSSFKDQWPGSDSNTNETQIIKLFKNEDKSLIQLFMGLINLLRGTSFSTGH